MLNNTKNQKYTSYRQKYIYTKINNTRLINKERRFNTSNMIELLIFAFDIYIENDYHINT